MAEQAFVNQARIAQLEQIRDDLIARIAELEAGIDRIATRAEKNIHSSGYVARQLRALSPECPDDRPCPFCDNGYPHPPEDSQN